MRLPFNTVHPYMGISKVGLFLVFLPDAFTGAITEQDSNLGNLGSLPLINVMAVPISEPHNFTKRSK